jgi:ribonuclease HI
MIYTDAHLNGLNGLGGEYSTGGYTHIRQDNKDIIIDYMKKHLTNNEAELLAVFHALTVAREYETICTDSQIACSLSNRGKSKEPRFELLAMANNYLLKTKKCTLKWIPREQNPVT